MRKFSLKQNFNVESNINNENLELLYHIGRKNPYNIQKISPIRKVDKSLNFSGFVKLGKLNLQRALGKNRYSLSLIKKVFHVSQYKHMNEIELRCEYFINKSHHIFIQANEFARDFNRNLPDYLDSFQSEISKKIAPYHIKLCYTFYNSDDIKQSEIKNYLKVILREIENIETK